jgi:threonine/homoserine/homoserine lactone efflux protein
MRASAVVAFVVVDVLLVLTPGPDWAYVIAVGLGKRTLFPAVAGLVAGYGVLTVLVAAGLGALIAATPGALTAVTLIGGTYLVWLGVHVVSRRQADAHETPAARPVSTVGVAVRGFGTSGLNPKGLLLFVAVLPQFVNRHGTWPVAAQIILLGATHMANCAAGYLALGSLTSSALGARPTAAHTLARAAGAAMIVLGALLLVGRAFGVG